MGIVKKTTDEILYVSVKKLIPGLLIMIYLKKSHNEIDERRTQFLILNFYFLIFNSGVWWGR